MSFEQIKKEIESIKITKEKSPNSEEYKTGFISYRLKGGKYIVRDEPLSSFKKNTPFRNWGESILNNFYLEKDYTLIYYKNSEWYDGFKLEKI